MKTVKKALIIFVFVLLSAFFVVSAGATETGISEFSVNTTVGENEITVNWWQGNGGCYLFLPSDIDISALTVNFTASGEVLINGETVNEGDSVAFAKGNAYTLTCDGVSYSLTVLQSSDVPSLHITTESGSMDEVHASKSHKEKAGIVIVSDGEDVVDTNLDYIKGRGNSTWALKKKPYNIKFEKKTNLFDMGKAKKWSLLANYLDDSDMRNHIVFELAETVGLEYTSKSVSVDLFINGDYYGNYLLCESVEVGETRVDINDLEGDTEDVNEKDLDEYTSGGAQVSSYKNLKAGTQKWVEIPNNPEDITGGYLLEYELPNRYVKEVSGFVTDRHQTIVLKSPEYATEAQVKYISALYQEFEDALFSETGYNSLGKHYTEYIDVESFAKMYVLQEYVKNLDAGLTSFYIYKDNDSDVFAASPVWDFDYALGNSYSAYGTNISYAEGWWASKLYYRSSTTEHPVETVLNALCKHDDFFAEASEEWNTVFAPSLTTAYFKGLEAYADKITDSAVMNAILWNTFETGDAAAVKTSYKSYVKNTVIGFMKERKTFLNEGFADDSVRVFFDANGGEGNMFYEDAAHVGDSITLPVNEFENSGKLFVSWNTKADGTGEDYVALSRARLDDTNVTFYAQWSEIGVFSGFQKIINTIKSFFEGIRSFLLNLFGF